MGEELIITRDEYQLCVEFTDQVQARHQEAGHRHRRTTRNTPEAMRELAIMGKAGELALCNRMGGVMDWNPDRADRGWDIEKDRFHHAVRTRGRAHRDLLAPGNQPLNADFIHVLRQEEPLVYEYVGWVRYDEWTRRRYLHDFGYGRDWFFNAAWLEPSLEKLMVSLAGDRERLPVVE